MKHECGKKNCFFYGNTIVHGKTGNKCEKINTIIKVNMGETVIKDWGGGSQKSKRLFTLIVSQVSLDSPSIVRKLKNS